MGVVVKRKLTALLVVAVFLLVGGCSEKSESVVSPIDSPSPVTSVRPGANIKAESPIPTASIQPGSSVNCVVRLIELPLPLWGTNPGASSTSYITSSSGGQVRVSYSYTSILRKLVRISATLSIPPGAIDKDRYITMSLDDKYVGLKFKPGGLKFNIPAKLDFNATGLDLSVVPFGAQLSLYYVNDFGSATEKEKAKKISANAFYGSLVCDDGEIPHFSRYAFGY
jgi:hypothetical protein